MSRSVYIYQAFRPQQVGEPARRAVGARFAGHVCAATWPRLAKASGSSRKTSSKRSTPFEKSLNLRSAEDAAKHFSEDKLAKLIKRVGFEQWVFAWRGSGQDPLEHGVAESYPEQISFTLRPGRTRDLRPHVKVFALRANVKWSVKTGR
jgi:hypothetical protein